MSSVGLVLAAGAESSGLPVSQPDSQSVSQSVSYPSPQISSARVKHSE
jgi:hypothetical protein